jgi:GDPmannose 4,6-dehydratase
VSTRTALVTGILGQDGSLLAELLIARGYRVVGVTRPGAQPSDTERRGLRDRCELVAIDLANPGDARWATELVARVQPDEVYHLAACHRSSEAGQGDDDAQNQRMVAVNVDSAVALAHAVLARGTGSLVVAGSSQMYTPAIPPLRVDEHTPHDPATFYGVTKSRCASTIRALREREGLHGSCAILFNHESPRRSANFASRKITRAAARIAAGLETTLELADLSSRVDYSAAADVVTGLHAMATASRAGDRVIASGELHSLAEVCEVAFAAVGLDWRAHVRSTRPPGDRPAVLGDPSTIETELGWQRTRTFARWIEEMVEADRRQLAG